MKKLKLYLLPFAVALVLLLSCKSKTEPEYAPPIFPIVEEIKSQRLSENLTIFDIPYDLFVDENYIYILTLLNDKWVQIYDKNNGKHIGGIVHRGRGRGEVNTAISINYNEDTRKLYVQDQVSSQLYCYQLTDNSDIITYLETVDFSNKGTVHEIWHLSDDRYLVDGNLRDPNLKTGKDLKRFQILESEEITARYHNFPLDDSDDKWAFLTQRHISLSTDKTKMAFATMYGGFLEIFDVRNGIKLDTVRTFYPPHMKIAPGLVRGSDQTIYGFCCMKTTNKLIYTVMIEDKDPNQFNKISIFDWDGNEVAQYHSDCLLLRLYVRESEPNKIYGIAVDDKTEELYLVSYTLDIPEYS